MNHLSNGNGKSEDFILEILNTREVRGMLGAIVPEVLKVWAGKSAVKKAVINPVAKNIQSGFKRPDDILEEKELQNLFGTSGFIDNIAAEIPSALDSVFHAINKAGEGIEALPNEKKQVLFGQLVEGLISGRSGAALTTFSRVFISIHKENPEFLSQKIQPGVIKWLESTDFGEIRDALECATDDIVAISKSLADAIMEYPSKLIVLLTFIPGITNILVRSANEWLLRLNTLAPDLISDAMLSVLRNVDTKTFSPLINQSSELIRKLNTGSALLGDPGQPQFAREIKTSIENAMDGINIELLLKAKAGLQRGSESVHEAMTNVLRKHPELILHELESIQDKTNGKIKKYNKKLNLILDELPEEEMAESAAKGISNFDANEAAEAINLTAICVNKIKGARTNLLSSIVNQFINGLDLYEVEDMAKDTFEDLGESLKPLGSVIMPQLIKMIGTWMTPDEDEDSEEIDQAREALRSFLNKEEVTE